MESKKSRFRIHWFWGFVGCCGSLGLILGNQGTMPSFRSSCSSRNPLSEHVEARGCHRWGYSAQSGCWGMHQSHEEPAGFRH